MRSNIFYTLFIRIKYFQNFRADLKDRKASFLLLISFFVQNLISYELFVTYCAQMVNFVNFSINIQIIIKVLKTNSNESLFGRYCCCFIYFFLNFPVSGIMKREADGGTMTGGGGGGGGGGGPTSPHKRYRQGDDELRLLIPSKVSDTKLCIHSSNDFSFFSFSFL